MTFPSRLTGRSDQGFNIAPAPAVFDFPFPLRGRGSVRIFLRIDQVPRPFRFSVLGTALVVTLESVGNVLCRPCIVTAILLAFEYVDKMKHDKKPIAGKTIGFEFYGGDDPVLRTGRPSRQN
jgi:hypothetical protein